MKTNKHNITAQIATMQIVSNKVDRLTKIYLDTKRNPEKILKEEAQQWRDSVCRPTPNDPYKESLPFTEAYENYILPELSTEKREDLLIGLEKIPTGEPVITSAIEEELIFIASDYEILLGRLDQLELEVAMLKSQNSFADVVDK